MQQKEIKLDSKLKFRNQFIVSPEPIDCFPGWKQSQFIGNNIFIYAHPSLGLHTISNESKSIRIVLLGFVIDPDFPQKKNKDLLKDIIAKTNSLDDFSQHITRYAGRFVFILRINGQYYFFHDAGGLRTIFYAENERKKYVATQPLLFKKLFPLVKSGNYDLYVNSKHYKENIEYWVPSGVTLYDNVHHLIPNHYLDYSTFKQGRYYPTKKLQKLELADGTEKAAIYIKNLLYALSLRYKLALPLTAGTDSRILMAALNNLNIEPFYYTLYYSRFDKTSYDINIPKHILKKKKKKHHIIDCQSPTENTFLDFYKKNVDLAHKDWARNIYGMFNNYPEDSIDLKGNVSEIARSVVYPDGIHPKITSLDQIKMYLDSFRKMPFVMNSLEDWFQEAIEVSEKTGFKILDIFYWEIRTGSWYAQANNEMDILTETFTPFNFRPLLETMLGVPGIYRQRDASIMHNNIVEYLSPELMYWPVNRRWNKRDKLKFYMAAKFKKIGIFKPAQTIYRRLYHRYERLKERF